MSYLQNYFGMLELSRSLQSLWPQFPSHGLSLFLELLTVNYLNTSDGGQFSGLVMDRCSVDLKIVELHKALNPKYNQF